MAVLPAPFRPLSLSFTTSFTRVLKQPSSKKLVSCLYIAYAAFAPLPTAFTCEPHRCPVVPIGFVQLFGEVHPSETKDLCRNRKRSRHKTETGKNLRRIMDVTLRMINAVAFRCAFDVVGVIERCDERRLTQVNMLMDDSIEPPVTLNGNGRSLHSILPKTWVDVRKLHALACLKRFGQAAHPACRRKFHRVPNGGTHRGRTWPCGSDGCPEILLHTQSFRT